MARSYFLDATLSAENKLYNKAAWRLIPFLFICYVAAYLDRVNVGFAELQMKTDLKFSDTVYGLGAGIFFIGYFFFEVPSNILLYLTYWFPSRRRGQMIALFMLAIAFTGVIGGPISGLIMGAFRDSQGLKAWQMLFLLEAVPSIALGFLVPL